MTHIDNALDADGLDRRKLLSCMAWVGTGLLWTMSGGVPRSSRLGAQEPGKGDLFSCRSATATSASTKLQTPM